MGSSNERYRAVALRYDQTLPAPFVVAKGRERLAERIVELARSHNIPIVDDPSLTDSLFTIEIADMIPEDLYRVVAELLIFIRTL